MENEHVIFNFEGKSDRRKYYRGKYIFDVERSYLIIYQNH